MSAYLEDGYYRETAAEAPKSARIAFIRRTYAHLFAAIVAFVAIEAALLHTTFGIQIGLEVIHNRALMLMNVLLFIGVGFVARYMARSEASPAVQYMGLAMYVVAEALILLPLLVFCSVAPPQFRDIPMQAGILTLTVFGGITAVVFISKKDFSFLGHVLWIGGLIALGLIVASFIVPLSLGIWFSAAMIALACGYILYDTSNILHHYGTNAHVAAALELFASVATLFFYIIRLRIQIGAAGDN
jgi:FtsH-binding integral membrane protein